MIQISNKNVRKLDLSNKNLKEFPREVLDLKNLRKLNLSNNQIKELPKEIAKLRFLETLDLSNNLISNFYSKVCDLTNLRILNLNNNKIKVLPKQISNFNKLISFHISNNKLESLPDEIFTFINLRELDLSKNPLNSISEKIRNFTNLRKLWIGNLNLKEFPANEIKLLPNLKSLYCYGILSTTEKDQSYEKLTKLRGNCLIQLKFNEVQNEIAEELAQSNEVSITKEDHKNKIFISYCHQDKNWLNRVQTHLKVLKNYLNLEFDVWDDQRLITGDDWEQQIGCALNNAQIAILIISTDFLASDFITKKEIPPILFNAEKNGLIVMPIIVEHCLFSDVELSKFQAANSPSEPLGTMKKSDSELYLLNLTKDIKKHLAS